MRSIEFVNEVAGLSVASAGNKLAKYFKPNIIKVSSPHGNSYVMDSQFLAAAVTFGMDYQKKAFDGISSVAWLGMAADRDVMLQMFTTAGGHIRKKIEVRGIKGMWGEYEPTVRPWRDPAGRYVVLGKALIDYVSGQNKLTRAVVGSGTAIHEYMHRGCGMISKYDDINKFCKGISTRPFKQPWERWGQKASHGLDTLNSMNRYDNQYGTVEHMMIYGALGEGDLYYNERHGLKAWYNNIPGMKEEFPNYRQDPIGETKKAMSIASTNLKVLGQGVDAWLANFAKEKAQISDDDIALMMVDWGRRKIPSIREAYRYISSKDFLNQ